MSETGQMGATETFDWHFTDGRVMRVTVDRGLLAVALARKLLQPGKGGKAKRRITKAEGAIVAQMVQS